MWHMCGQGRSRGGAYGAGWWSLNSPAGDVAHRRGVDGVLLVDVGPWVCIRWVGGCCGRRNSPVGGSTGDVACRSSCGWGLVGCWTS